jgi:2-polyprenyl-6-methoxyphenol hydroxylase-like FAD-dependent oxidoreductase
VPRPSSGSKRGLTARRCIFARACRWTPTAAVRAGAAERQLLDPCPYSVAPRSYARDRLCLAGDAGAVFPPFTGSGVLKAVVNATSLAGALAGAPAVDDALHRWSQAQLQVAAQVMPTAELIERRYVFGMPDLTTMPAAATNDWMSSAFSGFGVTLPDV